MDTIYNKEEEKYERMNLDSEQSTPDPHNPDQVIDSDDEMKIIEKHMEDYYESNIDHNYPNFHMIWEKIM